MAQRLPLVGLRREFGDAVTRRDGGAVQGEQGEGRGWEGHLPGGWAWGDRGWGRGGGGGGGGGADGGGVGGKKGLRQQVAAGAALRGGQEVQRRAKGLPRRQRGGAVRGR